MSEQLEQYVTAKPWLGYILVGYAKFAQSRG